ncbi:RhoGAP-domain-containing protein [Rhodotorula sp. JG-1b]|nr:RhoGAP-domain-containing protein [Rhodotorula sp. JG-1b]
MTRRVDAGEWPRELDKLIGGTGTKWDAAVSLSVLLVEHDNDPARALATLVSRYNRLVSQHAALTQERDSAVQDATRSAQENELLWRSFKANSPRPPPVARSNSDQHAGAGAGSSTRGLGIGPTTPGHGHGHGHETTPNLRATKRMPSTDSGLFNRHDTFLSSSSTTSSSSSPLFPPAFSSSSPRAPPSSADPAAASSHWLDYPPTTSTGAAAEPSPRSAASFGHASHNYSPSSLRGKSATPPPPGSTSLLRQTDPVPPSLLRKASSLDLGKRSAGGGLPASGSSSVAAVVGRSSTASRNTAATSSLSQESVLASEDTGALPSPPRPPQTPPPPGTNPPLLRRVQPSPRISGSASMPLLADSAAPLQERRFLPTLSPVSPFSFSGGNGSHDAAAALLASTTGLRTAAAAGEQLQAQLQLPRRERTISSGSSSFAGPALDEQRAGGGLLASPPHPPPPPRSASIQASLSSASPFRTQQHQYPSTSSSSSLRERRPSVPNKLQYSPSSSASMMTSALSGGLGGSASDGALVGGGASTSASAPVSRRPSDSSAGGIPSQPQPRGGLGTLPSPKLQPPISPRTPLPMERQTRPVLSPSLLPFAQIRVVSSSLRITDRHKELVWFRIGISLASVPASELEAAAVAPTPSSVSDVRQGVPTTWRVEKSWIELQALDAQVRSKASRQESKGLSNLPDKSLFKDHAPQRSDQRKSLIERYLQALTTVSLRDKAAFQTFLTSDVVPDGSSSASASSAKEGWLTKKGRAFGGWQTRYYILTPGSALAYYDTPGGSKVGEIPLQTAQIGRQSSRAAESGDDAYAHALLIRTQTGKDEADHILCADNDEERDAWIQALTTLGGPTRNRSANATTSGSSSSSGGTAAARSPSTERERVFSSSSLPMAPPIPTISHEPDSPRVQQEWRRSGSGPASMSVDSHSMMMQPQQQPQDPRGLSVRSAGDQLPPSVSLPSNLDALARGMPAMEGLSAKKVSQILEEETLPSSEATNVRSSRMNPTGSTPATATSSGSWRSLSAPDRPQSPDKRNFDTSAAKYSASDVSSPMNAVPLPSGFEFKKIERQKKTKSSFWNFTSRGSNDKAHVAAPARPVFGVPLKEAVSISRIRPGLELPAIVYRCVEFLEAKNAENEEGIFRLSGSTNVIRQLKERFDAEGDVNLLQSSEFYDLHAVAGLLKQYLRDLPPPLLTRTLQPDFLRVIDLRGREDQVNALGKLVQQLPIEEYTLFRFFFAHLCTIAQNAETSKMNLRNLGIVFSPTLAIPAPLFTLFLSEFDLVFAVDRETGAAKPTMLGGGGDDSSPEAAAASSSSTLSTTSSAERRAAHRNSLIYEASGANKLMESELLKLRENDDDEPVSGTSEADHHHHHHLAPEAVSADPRAATPISASLLLDRNSSAFYTASPSALSAPSSPRSAGLPSSPRPGASFQT